MQLAGRRVLRPVPRDDQWVDERLCLRSRIEKGCTLRRAQPLVTVAGVHVCTERLELEVDLAGCVCSVDDESAPTSRARRQSSRRVTAARPLDVRAEHDPCARAGLELGERAPHERGAGAPGDEPPDQLESAVSASPRSTSSPDLKLSAVRPLPRRAGGRPEARFSGRAPTYAARTASGRVEELGKRRSRARNSTGCRSSRVGTVGRPRTRARGTRRTSRGSGTPHRGRAGIRRCSLLTGF